MEDQAKRKLESKDERQSKTPRREASLKSTLNGTYIELDGKTCYHQIAWPKDQMEEESFPPVYDGILAKNYPFELDPFQTTAIACLEAGDSVLVSAHTSAGKTVVAQYACAMALRDKTRMIYTSPLKALSNQKYRELFDDFRDVGLLTGDVTINETASCLVVTTEVFRSMLYENNAILREIKSVVFDEVHYLRDKERGVVWEECLILMPLQVQAVFLSATVPNAVEFASWFATIHQSKCHVIRTDNRPVPLQHYVFPTGSDGIYLTMDEKRRFLEDNFQKACSEITGESITSQIKRSKDNASNLEDASDMFKLMKMILQRGYDPVIVFAFSKRTCELLALQLIRMDVNDDEEKQLIDQIMKNALDVLSDRDRRLPQVQHLLPMLKRGIGVHHSGLLPIVKEIVELLFQEGLVKVLFATETFSTGLNMPAKTVVFAGATKFDDGGFRRMYAGEYIQMSGRAGRRGIDEQGIVIFIADKSMDVAAMRDILKGAPLALVSEFRISFRMVLDNLKMEGGDPESVIRKSFRQFLCQASLPEMKARLQKYETEMESWTMDPKDRQIQQCIEHQFEKERLENDISQKTTQPRICLPFLNPGRLVALKPHQDLKKDPVLAFKQSQTPIWGTLVNFTKQSMSNDDEKPQFLVDVLVNSKKTDEGMQWIALDEEDGQPRVIAFHLDQVLKFSSIRLHLPKNLKPLVARVTTIKCLKEAIRRLVLERNEIPLLDPIKDMKIENKEVKKALKKLKTVKCAIEAIDIKSISDLEQRIEAYFSKKALLDEKKQLEKEMDEAKDMILKQELRRMLKLLIRLEYIDETGLVLNKGRIALHFKTADELLLTEMIINGRLFSLSPSEIAAVVSCTIPPDGNPKETKVKSEFADVFRSVEQTATEIGQFAVECKVVKHVKEYTQRFKPWFMEAIHAWSNGASFMEIIQLSDTYEGSVVRTVRQIDRVLTELEAAVKSIGQQELEEKIQTARQHIERDVVFAGSLYL